MKKRRVQALIFEFMRAVSRWPKKRVFGFLISLMIGLYLVTQVEDDQLLYDFGLTESTAQFNSRQNTQDNTQDDARNERNQSQSAGEDGRKNPSAGSDNVSGSLSDDYDQDTTTWSRSLSEIKRLESCLESETCKFSHDTPASYDLSVHKEIAREVRSLETLVRSELKTDPQAESSLQLTAEELARDLLLNSGNDDVREASIDLIALFPPKDTNMMSVMHAIETTASGPLAARGLIELRRYVESGFAKEIETLLLKILQYGPEAVSREIARGSLPFLTPGNAQTYSQLMNQLPARSLTRRYLRLNIEEYERMQNGG